MSRGAATGTATATATAMSFLDIGCNLLDPMFRGCYRGKQYHEDDFDSVLQRGWDAGVREIIITAGSLSESREALELARSDSRLYSTVGVHPTRCGEFDEAEGYMQELVDIAVAGKAEGKVVAIGEMGLDADRTNFCALDTQRKYFTKQLSHLASEVSLPLFIHSRSVGEEMARLLGEHGVPNGGVVHSFDGTVEEMQHFLDIGMHIGINGCSLKTQENLEVAAAIPLDRLLIETDGPWCGIKRTHAGFDFVSTTFPAKKEKKWEPGFTVKNRTEPCHIVQVAEIIAGARKQGGKPGRDEVQEIADCAYANSRQLFLSPSAR